MDLDEKNPDAFRSLVSMSEYNLIANPGLLSSNYVLYDRKNYTLLSYSKTDYKKVWSFSEGIKALEKFLLSLT